MSSTTLQVFQNPAGGALANDAAPNATEPSANRTWQLPRPQAVASGMWLTATGGGPTGQLWMRVEEISRWVAVGAPVVLAADASTELAPGAVPTSSKLFFQITANGGATAIAVGLTQGLPRVLSAEHSPG